MPNTRISYVCADGAGTRSAVVIPGTFAPEQIGRIIESLDRNIYFMPCKVGLPERGLDHGGPSGHGWFMLDAAGFEQTDEIESVDVSPDELTARFAGCAGRWESAAPLEI